jgi:hypothetical protein
MWDRPTAMSITANYDTKIPPIYPSSKLDSNPWAAEYSAHYEGCAHCDQHIFIYNKIQKDVLCSKIKMQVSVSERLYFEIRSKKTIGSHLFRSNDLTSVPSTAVPPRAVDFWALLLFWYSDYGVRLASHWTVAAFTGLLFVNGWEWMSEWVKNEWNGWAKELFIF